MINQTPSNFHVDYIDVAQHWSPDSEKYAGGDCLVTALYSGWEMNPVVYVERKWYAGARQITVYHVELERDGEVMSMPVLNNPYINRMIRNTEVQVQPIENR